MYLVGSSNHWFKKRNKVVDDSYEKFTNHHTKVKSLKSILLYKNIFDNECKTLIGCLTFIFYQKYFLWWNGLEAFLFSCDEIYSSLSQSPISNVKITLRLTDNEELNYIDIIVMLKLIEAFIYLA